MDLKKRLAQLDRNYRGPVGSSVSGATRSSRRPGDTEAALASLGLVRHDGAAGPVWYREHDDAVEDPAERAPDFTGFFTLDAAGQPPLAAILFLDTETTGLAGGTGTLVFELGVSWWVGGRLRTRQYFLPGPAHEQALLADLAGLAEPFSHIVTFNGASFDLPLLRTRALLNRTVDPLRHLVSWDLLVPSRRLWRSRLPDCRQRTVEQHVCGTVRRAGDIDGARIPQTWFDFLRTGEAGLLANVLTHNHRDMVGMARIFGRICHIAAWLDHAGGSAAWAQRFLETDRAGAWALGRVCERRSSRATAAACFRRACAAPWGTLASALDRQRFRRDAIRNLKRQQDWDLVEELIDDGLECGGRDQALHREAAILYEHRRVDLRRALEHAMLAGDGHRIARLDRLLKNRTSRSAQGA